MSPGRSKNSKKSKKRAKKLNLVFDEQKRREFLTGFHKRKIQRKKQAKEQFEKDFKDEKKRIKAEAKESYKKLVVSHRPIPELQDILEEEYEDENTTVKIVEMSTNDIAIKNNWIGANEPKYPSDVEENDNETAEERLSDNIPGMELCSNKKSVEKEKKLTFNSEKDIKKKLKKIATRTVQKSKIFQMKNKIERQKQKKKSFRQKKLREKIKNKGGKFR